MENGAKIGDDFNIKDIDIKELESILGLIISIAIPLVDYYTKSQAGILSSIDKINSSIEKQNLELRGYVWQSISSVRSFILTMVGFSFVVMGFYLNNKYNFIISYKNISMWGVFFLLLNILGSVYYLLKIYAYENGKLNTDLKNSEFALKELNILKIKYLNQSFDYNNYEVDISNLLASLGEKEEKRNEAYPKNYFTKLYYQKDKDNPKDWTTHVLTWLFIIGITFIVFGVISNNIML